MQQDALSLENDTPQVTVLMAAVFRSLAAPLPASPPPATYPSTGAPPNGGAPLPHIAKTTRYGDPSPARL